MSSKRNSVDARKKSNAVLKSAKDRTVLVQKVSGLVLLPLRQPRDLRLSETVQCTHLLEIGLAMVVLRLGAPRLQTGPRPPRRRLPRTHLPRLTLSRTVQHQFLTTTSQEPVLWVLEARFRLAPRPSPHLRPCPRQTGNVDKRNKRGSNRSNSGRNRRGWRRRDKQRRAEDS